MYSACPKCGHAPMPQQQVFPAACPACGVILAKVGQVARRTVVVEPESDEPSVLLALPDRVDPNRWWLRVALWVFFAAWSVRLIGADHRTGDIGESFLHGPLLIFHEAGHVLFALFGEWLRMAGGSIFQLLLPGIICWTFLFKQRDAFGAAIGLWLMGVSMLDLAPYVYDALHPQLMLITGATGEEGGHDWIYLLSSLHLLPQAQTFGGLLRVLGALVVIMALAWAGLVLWLQRQRFAAGEVIQEE